MSEFDDNFSGFHPSRDSAQSVHDMSRTERLAKSAADSGRDICPQCVSGANLKDAK